MPFPVSQIITQAGHPDNANSLPKAAAAYPARTPDRSYCIKTKPMLAVVRYNHGAWALTLGPLGPSLTPQTADPCTKQWEHLHVCLSLQLTTSANLLNSQKRCANQSLRDPAPPPPYPAFPTSGVVLPTGLRLLNLLFFLLRSPLPIAGVSPPSI